MPPSPLLQPAPAEKLPSPVPSSAHLVPAPPRYRHGPDPMDLPVLPFAPHHVRPRPYPRGAAPERPVQASHWVSLAMQAVHEDAVGPLKQALASPLCDLTVDVQGGRCVGWGAVSA